MADPARSGKVLRKYLRLNHLNCAWEAGKSSLLTSSLAFAKVKRLLVRPKINSPSPAQRSVQVDARKATSCQLGCGTARGKFLTVYEKILY
jgi:hypothetical protein